jgi:uncharacterized RDD family membrane protein YckC
MTGLTNSASAGDGSLDPSIRGLGAPGEPELARELPHDTAAVPEPEPDAWRQEVAARLARYRTRRKPRAPRYPSLFLPFDRDSWSRPAANANTAAFTSAEPVAEPTNDSLHHQQTRDPNATDVENRSEGWPGRSNVHRNNVHRNNNHLNNDQFDGREQLGADSDSEAPAEPAPFAKIIEFPRSAAIPEIHSTPLADPIFDRPRILEAPEVVPPPPALGGILIEPAQPEPANQPLAAESVIRPASVAHRLLGASLDALILAVTLGAFFAIFLRFNPIRGPLPLLAGVAGGLATLLWMVYQYVFIVGTGSTLGLRAARLTLTRFDGSPVPRGLRRWRVLASFLSAFSAGLGYLWCLLDQDSLCWHDRITRTHLQPKPPVR